MLDPFTITYAVGATLYGIYQKTQNTKLRREIERLTLIITELNRKIKENEEELRRLKWYHFQQMSYVKKKIKNLEKEKEVYKGQSRRLEREANKTFVDKADDFLTKYF